MILDYKYLSYNYYILVVSPYEVIETKNSKRYLHQYFQLGDEMYNRVINLFSIKHYSIELNFIH